jgi:hypothetical protein
MAGPRSDETRRAVASLRDHGTLAVGGEHRWESFDPFGDLGEPVRTAADLTAGGRRSWAVRRMLARA